MPKPILCPICSHKVPYGTIHEDLQANPPRFGRPHPGQSTIACACCGRYLHVACVEEAGTSIPWHHLWFSNMRMRAFIEEHRLMGQRVALCKGCHKTLSDQVVGNYKAMEKFTEGARFLEEFGRIDEAFELLAEIKG